MGELEIDIAERQRNGRKPYHCRSWWSRALASTAKLVALTHTQPASYIQHRPNCIHFGRWTNGKFG